MKRLLVAVDGSPHALGGVKWAADTARAMGLAIELVYVSRPNLLPPASYEGALRELEAAETAHAEQVFAAAERAAGASCVRTRATGSPAQAIADLCAIDGVWAVVIGAKGHNALSRMLVGSVADQLVHLCSKPVVVVR